MLFSKYTNSQLGAVVGVGRRRVGVAVGGRWVAVGGTGVNVGVAVARVVGVTVGVSVTVGVGVSVGVGVWIGVAVNGGVGVLVAVGVAVGAGAMRDQTGQVQLTVIIIGANIIARTVPLFLFRSVVLFPWPAGYCVRRRDLGCVPRSTCPRYYPPTYSKTMLVNCPFCSQLVNTMSSVSDRGTGLPWLSTMSI